MRRFFHQRADGRRGFLIVEAMVALSVLVFGFLGILALLTSSLHLTRLVSDSYTANYLALEGIEVTKTLVDADLDYAQNALNISCIWTGDPVIAQGGRFTVDANFPSASIGISDSATGKSCGAAPSASCARQCPASVALSPLSVGTSPPLWFDDAMDRYHYTHTGAATDFTRTIEIDPVVLPGTTVPAGEIKVKSTVQWGGAGGNSVTLEDHFFDWTRR